MSNRNLERNILLAELQYERFLRAEREADAVRDAMQLKPVARIQRSVDVDTFVGRLEVQDYLAIACVILETLDRASNELFDYPLVQSFVGQDLERVFVVVSLLSALYLLVLSFSFRRRAIFTKPTHVLVNPGHQQASEKPPEEGQGNNES